LKTTYGLVSNDGTVALSPSLDTIGPLARTVEDVALGLGLLTGESAPEISDLTPADLRLFVAESVVMDGVEAPIASAFDGALSRLSAAGSALARGPVPAFAKAEETARRLSFIVNAEAWQVWGAALAEKPDTVFPYIETRIRTGESVGAERLAEALATFAALRDETAAFIAEHGLLVMPTVPIAAPPVARLLADEAFYTERNLMALRNTRMANLLGLSALTLPMGTPMAGLMLVGPPLGEAALLAAGRAIEATLS
ncbi:MAG: amidase family protein, partial [Pseudomonadota bacterium]